MGPQDRLRLSHLILALTSSTQCKGPSRASGCARLGYCCSPRLALCPVCPGTRRRKSALALAMAMARCRRACCHAELRASSAPPVARVPPLLVAATRPLCSWVPSSAKVRCAAQRSSVANTLFLCVLFWGLVHSSRRVLQAPYTLGLPYCRYAHRCSLRQAQGTFDPSVQSPAARRVTLLRPTLQDDSRGSRKGDR